MARGGSSVLNDVCGRSACVPFFLGCAFRYPVRHRLRQRPSICFRSLGTQVHRTTAYHPQANGLCERFHRSLKAALRAALSDGNWVDRLPWVMLGLRSAPKEDLDASPAELVLGQPLCVPGEFLPESSAPLSHPAVRPFSLGSTLTPALHWIDLNRHT